MSKELTKEVLKLTSDDLDLLLDALELYNKTFEVLKLDMCYTWLRQEDFRKLKEKLEEIKEEVSKREFKESCIFCDEEEKEACDCDEKRGFPF